MMSIPDYIYLGMNMPTLSRADANKLLELYNSPEGITLVGDKRGALLKNSLAPFCRIADMIAKRNERLSKPDNLEIVGTRRQTGQGERFVMDYGLRLALQLANWSKSHICQEDRDELPEKIRLRRFARLVAAQEAKAAKIPEGNSKPARTYLSKSGYVRSAKVRVWILKNARGICECCNKPAPFKTKDGTPFLESHHFQFLAQGGKDTISNTVAVCPNCHSQLHLGNDAKELAQSLYMRIPRLE